MRTRTDGWHAACLASSMLTVRVFACALTRTVEAAANCSLHPLPPSRSAGHTVYTLSADGLIVSQEQTWSVSALEALRETFTPTSGPRAPLL